MKLYLKSITKKAIFIFLFALFLQFPLWFIDGIISERKNLNYNTIETIGDEWGGRQEIRGPFIIAEYYDKILVDGKTKLDRKKLMILPEDLNISVNLKDTTRKRGIYKSIVYVGDFNITGKFQNVKEKLPKDKKINSIYLVLGLTDNKAILKVKDFRLNGDELEVESGTGTTLVPGGISANINKINFVKNFNFDINLDLRGSESLSFLPFGKNNHFSVKSTWKDPSFFGILPKNRDITQKGFDATWDISHLVRNYRQEFISKEIRESVLEEGKTGVKFYEGITHYRQVSRATKYGILFIMLSLLVVYIFEIANKKVTHYIQYGVVGFSLTLFYLILLSLSEYLDFSLSYLIAAMAVVIPNSLYIKALTKEIKYGIGMFVFLSGIYIILYSILRIQNYSLLIGTALITIVLYILMYMTRNLEELNS